MPICNLISPDSIQSVAKTLAGSIIKTYNTTQNPGTPGIFEPPYYWWEAGAIWQGFVEYSHLTGDSQYDSLVSEALQWQTGSDNNFMPANQTKNLRNEDQSTWALAALTAAELGFSKPKNSDWLTLARNVFDDQVVRWQAEEQSKTCGGGLRSGISRAVVNYELKTAAANGQFFLLAARLAKLTGNETYTQWADKSFAWANETGLIGSEFGPTWEVDNGFHVGENCSTAHAGQSTSDLGVYTEGAAIMVNLVSHPNHVFIRANI